MQQAPLAEIFARSARVVAAVASGGSLAQLLPDEGRTPAIVDLTHGTLRRYGRVQALFRDLSRTGSASPAVESLLWCAFYAAESRRYAEFTLVDQAVHACRLLEVWNSRGFVNAVLRRYLRERDAIEARISAQPEARFWHPAWWIDTLKTEYPERWSECIEAGNREPTMALRVNRTRISRQSWLGRLAAAGLEGECAGVDGVNLARPVPVTQLPGFAEGEVSVQDLAAQRAADLLEVKSGERVLDACAAPGGKSAHLLERANIDLTALDVDRKRCERMRSNLDRLGLKAEVRTADCLLPEEWWDGRPYDRILVDAPCTASGIVRRHPDLKWLRRPEDAGTFARRQGAMLDRLWRTLRAGGTLLYATCSVFPTENENVIRGFLGRTADVLRLPLPDGGPAQMIPDPRQDGFFYALVQKRL